MSATRFSGMASASFVHKRDVRWRTDFGAEIKYRWSRFRVGGTAMYTIAIVEDTPDNLEFLEYILQDRYEIIRCESGKDALSKIRNQPPDLIIMDISLRDMDGADVLRQIRADGSMRNLPVIALTAHAMAGDREKYLQAGFSEYVSKPVVDIDVFLNTIQRHLPATLE